MGHLTLKLIKERKKISWILVVFTSIMVISGYAMTFFGVDIPLLRNIHFIFDVLFTITFIIHIIISSFIIKFRWKSILNSILKRKAENVTKLRFIQRISGWALFVSGGLQVIAGLDWLKLGLSSLLPYPFHRVIDLYLMIFLIAHVAIGIYFALLRRHQIEQLSPVKAIHKERREVIAIIGGSIIALFSALYLNNPPKIGSGSSTPKGTLPPGQTEIEKLKVLHTGIGVPPWDPDTWRFEVYGLVDNPISFTWEEFRALPSVTRISDFHCVTGWTKFDNKWEGVSFNSIKDIAKPRPNAKFATIECLRGYTTSLPITALLHQDVLFAYRLDDQELPREHGGPLRLVVPQKYAYKSAKWVIKVKFTERQELGYWESRGYSNTANPFTNDRYSTS
jgi:DMSO/TMAO reductase YedYZ molybdopterin-dependent catalytic subunit/succinate dehydrogenase/fumarate reductase cytochrome b subunit